MTGDQFSAETRTGISYRLALGMSLSEAAQAVGVNAATARGWLYRGRKAQADDLAEFAAAVEQARPVRGHTSVTGRDRRDLSQLVRAGSLRAAKSYWERFVRRA